MPGELVRPKLPPPGCSEGALVSFFFFEPRGVLYPTASWGQPAALTSPQGVAKVDKSEWLVEGIFRLRLSSPQGVVNPTYRRGGGNREKKSCVKSSYTE